MIFMGKSMVSGFDFPVKVNPLTIANHGFILGAVENMRKCVMLMGDGIGPRAPTPFEYASKIADPHNWNSTLVFCPGTPKNCQYVFHFLSIILGVDLNQIQSIQLVEVRTMSHRSVCVCACWPSFDSALQMLAFLLYSSIFGILKLILGGS